MSREQRPRRRLRSWLRMDDEAGRPRRRRSTARRAQEPPEFDLDEEIEYQAAARGSETWIDAHGCRQGGIDGIGWTKYGGY